MAEDIKRSDLLLSLIKLEKDKGFVSLVDVIAAKKSFKEGRLYSNDEIIEALKDFDVHYTESEDGSDYDEEEPTQEELEGKVNLEEPLSLDDDFDDFDDEPTADDLNELEKDVDFSDDDDKKNSDEDEDEDEDEVDEEEEYAEDNMNEWKGTDEDAETSERFIDISSFSEHTSEHRSAHQSSNKYDTSQDDPIRLYLKEIGNEKLLTGEQEVELAKQMEKGSQIVNSVIRESGILITFFSKVIEHINKKIDEESEDTTSSPFLRAVHTRPRSVPQSSSVMITSCDTSTSRRVR